MNFEQIIYDKSDNIATITLNRPERMNAFTAVMIEEWYAALLDAHTDPDVRAVIVTGAGARGFCTGADVGGNPRGLRTEAHPSNRFPGRRPAHTPSRRPHGEALHRRC
jgi:enoyl-CoA hydratase/carnithine racemase